MGIKRWCNIIRTFLLHMADRHCLTCAVSILLQAPDNPENLDLFISIHSIPDFKSGVEPEAREVNMVYHLWLFQSVEMLGDKAFYLQETVEMGLYQPYNVTEVGQDVCEGSEELDGIAVNRLGPRVVEIVSVMCVCGMVLV